MQEYLNITLPPQYWSQIHGINGFIMVCMSLLLTVEKFYLISRGGKSAPNKEKEKKKKNN